MFIHPKYYNIQCCKMIFLKCAFKEMCLRGGCRSSWLRIRYVIFLICKSSNTVIFVLRDGCMYMENWVDFDKNRYFNRNTCKYKFK